MPSFILDHLFEIFRDLRFLRSIRPPPSPSLRRPPPQAPGRAWGQLKTLKISQKIAPAFSLPSRSRKRISSRARAPNMVKFGVSFSRGVKNRGCLFPKMVLFEGPRPSKSVKRLSNLSLRPSKSSKLSAYSGFQTLLREEIDKGWGGQSAPRITSFPASKKLRLVDFGKK